MIEVKGLTKKYGSFYAIKDVSFKVEEGEIVGFLGPNGAGKSTTMNIIAGYLAATDGSVTVNGYDVVTKAMDAKRRIGYLPEQPPLYPDMTVKAYLDFVFDLKQVKANRKEHIKKICTLVQIDNVYNRIIKHLSKGYRQRVGIAQALIGTPPIVILDEPTVGLDPKQKDEILYLIQALGKKHTVMFSSHILSEVQQVCQRVIIINKGEIIADGKTGDMAMQLADDKRFTVRISGPREEIGKTLAKVSGVAKVVDDGSREQGSNDFIVIPKPGFDVRREVFARVAEHKWTILNMVGNQMTLDDVFKRLTDAADEELEKEGE